MIDSVENNKALAWFNGERARRCLAIQRQPGTNTVEVVDNIRKLLPTFRKRDPAGGQSAGGLTTRRRASATRSATCSSRWC